MNLQQHFEEVEDYRVKGRCRHLLSDILILILCGVLADFLGYKEIVSFSGLLLAMKQYLEESFGYWATGVWLLRG